MHWLYKGYGQCIDVALAQASDGANANGTSVLAPQAQRSRMREVAHDEGYRISPTEEV